MFIPDQYCPNCRVQHHFVKGNVIACLNCGSRVRFHAAWVIYQLMENSAPRSWAITQLGYGGDGVRTVVSSCPANGQWRPLANEALRP